MAGMGAGEESGRQRGEDVREECGRYRVVIGATLTRYEGAMGP